MKNCDIMSIEDLRFPINFSKFFKGSSSAKKEIDKAIKSNNDNNYSTVSNFERYVGEDSVQII